MNKDYVYYFKKKGEHLLIKLPQDIHNELQKKYPTINMYDFIDDLFRVILNKTFNHGACGIREFGKFIAFKSISKDQKESIKFKFKISLGLKQKIKNDSYILTNIPVKLAFEFNEKNAENCKDKQELRELNDLAMVEAERISREKTKEKLAEQEIVKLLELQ